MAAPRLKTTFDKEMSRFDESIYRLAYLYAETILRMLNQKSNLDIGTGLFLTLRQLTSIMAASLILLLHTVVILPSPKGRAR